MEYLHNGKYRNKATKKNLFKTSINLFCTNATIDFNIFVYSTAQLNTEIHWDKGEYE